MSTKIKGIYLIGAVKHSINGCKLPSIGDVLKVLFYNMRYRKFSFSESVGLVIQEALIYWVKARIPTQQPDKCRAKLRKQYDQWKALVKKKPN